jgi:formylglycine-generating enzyme required for sulfatase activity
MSERIRMTLITFVLILASVLCAHAQLRPEAPPEPNKPPTTKKPAPTAISVRENPKDGLKYVWIPAGKFQMGCSPGDSECAANEKPSHQVNITKGFWLGQTEVTVGAYKRFAAATGRQMPPEPDFGGRSLNPGWGNEAMPIVNIIWDEAKAYCSWGSTEGRYGDLDEIAWYADNSGRQRLDSTRIRKEGRANYMKRLGENGNGMHEVGQKRANAFGLYDILGNMFEWVNDWYDEKYYQSSPSQDPAGPTSGTLGAQRGGAWNYYPEGSRVSFRGHDRPAERGLSHACRCRVEVFAP